MNLYDTLIQQLEQNTEYLTEEGQLKKWMILSKAQSFDEDLIRLLLQHKKLKEQFFTSVDKPLTTGENAQEILLFNQALFVQFLEQKSFLKDSYTKYKNKVGLQTKGRYLNQQNEVALVWPYKDCILEGGQSREEDQREELFFNEILAQDEITQLLEPKVFTNVKRHEQNRPLPPPLAQGKKKNSFTRDATLNESRGLPRNTLTDNLIVKGNNLLVLHSLKKEFAGKVKLIYIDPPYNTGGDTNTFTYNNTFNHSTWLTFMKNRLEVARTFLTPDGFICMAIDHYELGYLIVLADEIFGRENRIGVVSIVNNPMGRNQAKYFSTINDFMLVYAKDVDLAKFNNVVLDEKVYKSFDQEDAQGKYKLKDFIRRGGGDVNLRINKKSFWYPIYVKKDLSKLSIEKRAGYQPVYPITRAGQERTWKLSKKTTAGYLSELVAKKEKGKIVLYEKYRIGKGQKVPTIWNDKKYNANHQGKRLLEQFITQKNFSYPKSLYTVIDTLKIMAAKDDLILDFHAGSGTTGHAVLELNREDGGNRQFILVEQLEDHIAVCKERLQNVIRRDKKGAFVSLELKKYNQVFVEKIIASQSTESLIKLWEEMKIRSFLNYEVQIQKQDEQRAAFKKKSLQEQRQHLLDLLDKNQLYVNLSSLNDADFDCTPEEKEWTRDFYGL